MVDLGETQKLLWAINVRLGQQAPERTLTNWHSRSAISETSIWERSRFVMVMVEQLSLSTSRGSTVFSDSFTLGPKWPKARYFTISECAFKLGRFPNEMCETDYRVGEGKKGDVECILRFTSRYTSQDSWKNFTSISKT